MPVRLLRQQRIQMLDRGMRLIAGNHPVNLFDVASKIRAAKLQLLATTTRTRRVRINCHDYLPFELMKTEMNTRIEEIRKSHAA